MRTTHEAPSHDDIPTLFLVGWFFLVAAGFVFLIGFPLFQPFFAALFQIALVLIEFSDVFAMICLIGFLVGLPFCAISRFNAEAFGERATSASMRR